MTDTRLHPSAHRARIGHLALLYGLVAAPVAWIVSQIVNSTLAQEACFPGTEPLRAPTFDGVHAIQAALPSLKAAPSASMVLFSTVAVAQGMPFHASIAAAKGAVEGLTRSLAAEHAPRIRVNAIAPGLVQTDFAGYPAQSKARGLKPETVADGICYLLAQGEDARTSSLVLRHDES